MLSELHLSRKVGEFVFADRATSMPTLTQSDRIRIQRLDREQRKPLSKSAEAHRPDMQARSVPASPTLTELSNETLLAEECLHCHRDDLLDEGDEDEVVFDCGCCDATLCIDCWRLTHGDAMYEAGCCIMCIRECTEGEEPPQRFVAQKCKGVTQFDVGDLQAAINAVGST